MKSSSPILSAVLFDLDGTLLDTAPDLAQAFNQMRIAHHQKPLPLELIRQYAGTGSRELLKYSFDLQDEDERIPILLKTYYDFYEKKLAEQTQFYEGMPSVLAFLDHFQIPFGIVTNKISRFTHPLVNHFQLKTKCIVCSDTLNILKPDPAPLLHACELLQVSPQQVLYVGDTHIDIEASQAANMMSALALYGYLSKSIASKDLNATYSIATPMDLIPIIQSLRHSVNTHEKNL